MSDGVLLASAFMLPFGALLLLWYGLRRVVSERLTRLFLAAMRRTRIWLFHRGFAWLRLAVAWLLSSLYVLLPLDLIPDVVLGVGWLDDALLTLLLQWYWLRDWLACTDTDAEALQDARWFRRLFHGLGWALAVGGGVTGFVVLSLFRLGGRLV